jgi:hypothetical protein
MDRGTDVDIKGQHGGELHEVRLNIAQMYSNTKNVQMTRVNLVEETVESTQAPTQTTGGGDTEPLIDVVTDDAVGDPMLGNGMS